MSLTTAEIENSAWNRLFSNSIIRSYADGAFTLYETLIELEDNGYEALVYPSRGTTPFKGLIHSVHTSSFVKQRGATPQHHRVAEPFAYRTIDLPFTADPPLGIVEGHAQIRSFWVRVLKALLEHDAMSPDLRYFQHCLEGIFGFERSLGLPLRRPGTRFVFVDTVLSGQAVCEIAAAFEAHGLTNFYFVLLVDEKKHSVDSVHGRKIAALVAKGMAKLIFVESLFTEDRGPAMTSTWCLSAPQFVTSAHSVIHGCKQGELVGTAVSFLRVSEDEALGNESSTRMSAVLNQLVYLAMCSLLEVESETRGIHDRVFEKMRMELVELAMNKDMQGNNPLLIEETQRIAKLAIQISRSIAVNRLPIRLEVSDVTVSNSHVVRLLFDDDDVRMTLKDFSNSKEPAQLSVHEP